MRSAERLLNVALLTVLGACASAPEVVKKPMETVQQVVSTTATAVAAAVPVVTEAPVDPQAQRAFENWPLWR